MIYCIITYKIKIKCTNLLTKLIFIQLRNEALNELSRMHPKSPLLLLLLPTLGVRGTCCKAGPPPPALGQASFEACQQQLSHLEEV